MRKVQWGRSIIVCVVASLMMLGMSGTVTAQDGTPETAASFPVNVTFVNGLTSLDSIDVYINGDDENQRVVEGLEYGTVSESFEGKRPGHVDRHQAERQSRLRSVHF